MKKTTIFDAKRTLRLIAKEEGKPLQEIRQDIEYAMAEAMKSEDPVIQRRWRDVPHKGTVPTPEEFIAYIANSLRGDINE